MKKVLSNVAIFLNLIFVLFASASIAKASIDLTVSSITSNPSSPAFNEETVITVKIKNDGDEDASNLGDLRTNFQNFTQTDSNVYSEIAAGATKSFIYNGYFTQKGEWTVGFEVDDNNAVVESEEGNNYLSKKIIVTEQYDLSVEDIVITPISPAVDQDVKIMVKVKNLGYARLKDGLGINAFSYSFMNFEEENNSRTEVNSDNPILKNEYIYYNYNGKFTSSGKSELIFTIDTSDQLDEVKEDNNEKTKTIEIFDKAGNTDMAVASIVINKAKPILDEAIVVTVTVQNNSKYSITDDIGWLYASNNLVFPVIPQDLFFDFNGMEITKFEYPTYSSLEEPLNVNGTKVYKFTGKFTGVAGKKNLLFNFNEKKRLAETSYSNNVASTSIFVYKNAEERDAFEIKNFRIEAIDMNSVYVKCETDVKTSGTLFYKRSDFTSYNELKAPSTLTQSIKATTLYPGLRHNFKIELLNSDVEKTSEVITFLMPETNDLKFSLEPNLSLNEKEGSVTINFATNFLSSGSVYLRKIGGDYTKKDVKEVYSNGSVTFTELTSGNYEYYLNLKNATGNILKTANSVFSFEKVATTVDDAVDDKKDTSTDDIATENGEKIREIKNESLYKSLKGKIVLTVEENGEAYYIHPENKKRYFLGRPSDAFQIMREQGVGISNANLAQIEVGLTDLSGDDIDGDGLSDIFEDAIGTDKNKKDSDGDGYDDKTEVEGGFNPKNSDKMNYNLNLSNSNAGKIFLQVEGNGEAWYINPSDSKRYFLGRPADAFSVMRQMGLGISNENFDKL